MGLMGRLGDGEPNDNRRDARSTGTMAIRLRRINRDARPAGGWQAYRGRRRVLYADGRSRTRDSSPGGTNTALPSCHTARGRPSRRCFSTTRATASRNAVNALRVIGFFGLRAVFIG